MQKDIEKTKVVFRKWKDYNGNNSIIALFPEIDEGNYLCSSYERLGQHGSADYGGVIAMTKPAKEEEFAALKKELENIGYNLDIKKKYIRK